MAYFRYYFLVFLFSLSIFVFGYSLAFADTIITDTRIDDIQTWNLSGSPYIFQNSSGGDVVITETGVLNIEAGVVVKAQNARKFDVYGTLNILGEEGNEVVLTNVLDAVFTTSDRWGGVVFKPGSVGNIHFLNERYTGWVQFPPGAVAILNLGGNVEIHNSTFTGNSHTVRQLSGATTLSTILIDGDHSGVTFEGGDLNMFNSKITNTSTSFLSYGGARNLVADGNIFENNNHNPFIEISIDFSVSNSTFIGGDYNNWLLAGSVVGEKTLFPIEGKPIPFRTFFIEAGNKLIVSPGTVLKGTKDSAIIVRGGEIEINGTKEEPVIFTSIADDAVGGDTNSDGTTTNGYQFRTNGVQVETGGVASLNNTAIGYGTPALRNTGGVLNVDKVDIENGNYTAIYHYDGVTDIKNSSLLSGSYNYGIVYENGVFNMHNSSFFSNADGVGNISFYSLWNKNNTGLPDVRENWWGTPEGPYHATDNVTGTSPRIQGNALFLPFLTEPTSDEPERNPVIIVPGIMGSYLNRTDLVVGNERWPNLLLMSLSPDDLYLNDLLLSPGGNTIQSISPTNVLSNIGNFDFFDGLTNQLLEDQEVELFPYDWRLDIQLSVLKLKEKIDQIRLETGTDKVSLVSHSMGGLVVKEYLNQFGGNFIEKFIDIATPHTGSPKSFKVLSYGDNFGFEKFGLNVLNPERAKIISQNMPSVYQLLPSFSYGNYLYDMDDLDSNGVRGSLSYAETKQFMKNTGRNSVLVDRADIFHQGIDNFNPSDYGVETYNIVGCGVQTLGKIFVLNEETSGDVEYNISYTNGDGTVPLKSAENIPAIKTYYAKNAVHATMPSISGVKELVASILSNDENFDISLYPNLAMTSAGCTIPNGRIVSFHSPIELHVYDLDGNHVGPNADGDIEINIPGVSYEVIDGNKFAFLPDGTEYIVKGNATASSTFNARVEIIENEVVVETKYFNQVPITPTTQVELTDNSILIDSDSDAIFESEFPVSSILDENESLDVIKPITTINTSPVSKKDTPFDTPVKATLLATDNNSGVLKTEYSLNDGQSWIIYTEPFTINTKGETQLLYKSTDRAGNIETPKTEVVTILYPGNSGDKR